MAAVPYFILSPNAILSFIGLVHGPDKTVPTPPEDWRKATVTVVIPAYNEEANIAFCLASLVRQTLKPSRIILVDDGSADKTLQFARHFCDQVGMNVTCIKREKSIGKTPSIKRQSREFESDVEFILDGDTILESPDYIARAVEELYKAKGIASACGLISPFRQKDRKAWMRKEDLMVFQEAHPEMKPWLHDSWFKRFQQLVTDTYRDILYTFLQRFIYKGQMVFFGGVLNPVGCAVAYRRKYIQDLFDRYEPILGDDLTNSEDIFIGFSMLNEGYRNIQLEDVHARSMEPLALRLPRQVYLWSSSFFQSCYYFGDLLASPFKGIKRWRHERKLRKSHVSEKRKIAEPYRQSWGQEYTRKYGRPIGWVLLCSVIEKAGFPIALTTMLALRLWEPLILTLVLESVISLFILFIVAKGKRISSVFKGLLITPIRHLALLSDLVTMLIFLSHVWFQRKDIRWRK